MPTLSDISTSVNPSRAQPCRRTSPRGAVHFSYFAIVAPPFLKSYAAFLGCPFLSHLIACLSASRAAAAALPVLRYASQKIFCFGVSFIFAPSLPDTGIPSPRTAFAFGYSGHTQRRILECISTLYQCSCVLAAAPTVFSPYIPLCKKAALRSPSDGTIIAR